MWCGLFLLRQLIVDVQPGNLLVEVNDPESIINSHDDCAQSSSTMKKGYSIIPSQPLFDKIERSHQIAIRLTDLGVGKISRSPANCSNVR